MSTRQTWALLARRRTLRRTLVEKVEVWRAVRTPDGQGGVTEAMARAATYPGRVEPVTERTAVVGERLGDVATAVIVLPHDAVALPGDEYRVNGVRYAFAGSDAGTSLPSSLRVSVSSVH